MEIITTVDGRKFIVNGDKPQYNHPYVFADANDTTKWEFGEKYGYFPSSGGYDLQELINPKIIRKNILKEVK